MEVWKDIPGYEGHYQASTLGNIRSLDRKITCSNGAIHKHKGRVLKQYSKQRPPYYIVQLGHRAPLQYVHVLVALTFLGPRPEGTEIRHLDCNSYNNAVSNLEYGSRRENSIDPWRNGRVRKLSPEQVLEIRQRLSAGDSAEILAHDYGVSSSMIRRIRRGCAFDWL